MICVTCPTCGGHLGELPEPDKVRKFLSPTELAIFNALLAAGPDGLDKIDLSTALYGDAKATSAKAMNNTASLVSRVRKKLDRYGYHIQRNPPLRHGVYKLIPTEAGQ